MNGIWVCKKVRGLFWKLIGREAAEKVLLPQRTEQLFHLTPDVLREAECTFSFCDPNRSKSAGPAIHVLEKVAVNSAVVPNAIPASRKRLVGTLHGNGGLEFLERRRFADAGNVLENRRPHVAVGVIDRFVEQPANDPCRTFRSGGGGAQGLSALPCHRTGIQPASLG